MQLTNDKILAHKVHGKNLIFLTQVESSYFLVVSQIVGSYFSKKKTLKTIFQKQLSKSEARAIFAELTGKNQNEIFLLTAAIVGGDENSTAHIAAADIVFLLENPKQEIVVTKTTVIQRPIPSPFFKTKEIFLSAQKTRAPSRAK